MRVEFMDEASRQRKVASFPTSEVTVAELKAQARQLFGFTVEDRQCEVGHGLKLFYPESGLDDVKVRFLHSAAASAALLSQSDPLWGINLVTPPSARLSPFLRKRAEAADLRSARCITCTSSRTPIGQWVARDERRAVGDI